ncbi:MAG: TDP-N-acetylfucosamine:lipid II N-acetylfucosaminyltransferase, partial [Candidatus Omnitrophica bacterium]|nr:TDP-N-acetylfucosamine:lipid II N-acetylfucosaminyltransferase [Candidatus Omnitrophota bacterium]
MNLHLMPDDKFLDDFIDILESVDKPDNNRYVAYYSHCPDRLEFIKSKKVVLAKYGSREFFEAVGDPGQYDKIFIHFFCEKMWKFVLSLPSGMRIYWLFWGGDFYSPREYYRKFLFDAETEKYLEDAQADIQKPEFPPLRLIKRLKKALQIYRIMLLKRKAIGRVSYLCHFNRLDFELIKAGFPTKAKLLPFFYPPFCNFDKYNFELKDSTLKDRCFSQGIKTILLGNSGFPTGNHLDALQKLRSLNGKYNFRVLCPLGYGDPAYIQYLIQKAAAILKDRFVPLTEFLEKQAYFSLLRYIDIIFMFQNRTQGGGNAAAGLYFGKKVYFKRENTLYRFFKENGLEVFDIETYFSDGANHVFDELPAGIKEKNRQIILELFSNEKAAENIKRMAIS